jgi:hypothetical protein
LTDGAELPAAAVPVELPGHQGGLRGRVGDHERGRDGSACQVEQPQLKALDGAEDSLGGGGEDDLLDRRVEGGEVDGEACSGDPAGGLLTFMPYGTGRVGRVSEVYEVLGRADLTRGAHQQGRGVDVGCARGGVPGEHRPEGGCVKGEIRALGKLGHACRC